MTRPAFFSHVWPGTTSASQWAYFWDRVKILSVDECWEWQSTRLVTGYGALGMAGKRYLAHRVAYYLANGPLRQDQVVGHSCDNPPCVNPSHLWLGTQLDNCLDRDLKGRTQRQCGENASTSKLTTAEVLEIRKLHGLATTREVGAKFGISNRHVSEIWRRKVWRHI